MIKIIFGVLLLLSFGANSLNANDNKLLSAKKIKVVSKKATEEAIKTFKQDRKCKDAYNEAKSIVAKQIDIIANRGLYDIVYVSLEDGTKYDKLSYQHKDMLEYLLKKELKKLGYKVESGRDDNIMLDWIITWK